MKQWTDGTVHTQLLKYQSARWNRGWATTHLHTGLPQRKSELQSVKLRVETWNASGMAQSKVTRSKFAKVPTNWECTWTAQEILHFLFLTIKHKLLGERIDTGLLCTFPLNCPLLTKLKCALINVMSFHKQSCAAVPDHTHGYQCHNKKGNWKLVMNEKVG